MPAEHDSAISTREALRRELTTGAPRWLPVVSLLVFFGGVALVVAVAGDTHGWDYVSYVNAAERFLAGEPIHDPTSDLTGGGQGIYLYPPAFAIVMVPFALMPPDVALWAWTAVVIAAFLLGALLLPVRPWVRWAVILLGGLSWPLLYSIKLGQVETLLFLAAAVGWRWMERPPVLGLSIAAGAVIKLQPIALLGWAVATRRWRAGAIGVVALAVVALVTWLLAPGSWADFVETLRQVGSPVTRPHNFSPGAVVFRLGASEELATAIQWVSVAAAGLVTLWAWFRLPAVPSYLLTILAVQIASPLLRDHYVLLLLLPAAWLIDSGRWWGSLLVLAYPLLAVTIIPAAAYPVGFWVGIVVLALIGQPIGQGWFRRRTGRHVKAPRSEPSFTGRPPSGPTTAELVPGPRGNLTTRGTRWARWLMVLSALALPPILLSPGLARGPTLDASVFMQVGSTVQAGGYPYLDAWDHKPPGIFIVEAAAGVMSPMTDLWITVWLLSSVCITVTLLLLGFAAQAPPPSWVGVAVTVGAAFVCSGYLFALGGGYTETIAILPATVGVVLAADRRPPPALLFAGALGAAAAAISLQLAPAFLAIELLAWRQSGKAGALWVSVGALLVAVLTLSWLWLSSALPSAFDALVVYNRAYVAGNGWNNRLLAWAAVSAMAAAALLIPAAARIAHTTRRPRDVPALDLAALAWLTTGSLFVVAQGNWFPHYAIALVPPLAILGRQALMPKPVEAIAVGLAGALALMTLPPFERHPTVDALVAQIRRLPPAARIFVWGNEPTIYILSARSAASKYVYMRPLQTPGYATDAVIDAVLEGWRERPPDAIIDASFNPHGVSSHPLLGPWQFPDEPVPDNLDPLRDFVRERYVVDATVGDWLVYVPR